MTADPCNDPLIAVIEEDVIIVEGCQGVNVTLTIDAAMMTADNIIDQVIEAKGRLMLESARNKRHN